MSEVQVMIDPRVRLVTAVLAASDWPEQEQARLRHAVHPHAKQTRQFVQPFTGHTAVTQANAALAAGVAVDDLFATARRGHWPDLTPQEALPASFAAATWMTHLADFAQSTAVATFADQHAPAWQEASTDLQSLFQGDTLPNFIERLARQPLHQRIMVMPNLVYPALYTVLAETADTLALIIPPPKAVGESAPWPYREGPDWALTEACRRLMRHTLVTPLSTLNDTQQTLFTHAAMTLFLAEALDEGESMAYMLRSRKQFRLPQLPLIVEALRGYLAGNGRTLGDFAW